MKTNNIVILAPFLLFLGVSNGFSEPDYVVASYSPSSVPTTAAVIKRADYVIFPASISYHGSEKDCEKIQGILEAATRSIEQALASNTNVVMSVRIGSKLTAYMPEPFTVVGAVANIPVGAPPPFYEPVNTVRIEFLYRIGDASTNADQVTETIATILKSQKLPDSIEYDLQDCRPQPSVINPDQYRKEVFTKILDEVRDIKNVFGSDSIVTLTGLEAPVSVLEKDAITVYLTIPYKASATMAK